MIYQFLGFMLPYAVGVDLILLGLIIISLIPEKKIYQRLIYGLGVFVFFVFVLFKWMFINPSFYISTTTYLKIETESHYTTPYYIRQNVQNEPEVFWKEHIIGKSKNRCFEFESSIADYGLVIATKFEDAWYSTMVQMTSNEVSKIKIEKSKFTKANHKIINALNNYKLTEFGNYFSNLLTLMFLIVLFWRFKKYGL